MYCKNCGTPLLKDGKFCPSCNKEQNHQNQTDNNSQNLVGYSDKINDPRVAAVMKKINSSGMVFTLILAVVAVLGFTVAGAVEVGDFELPSAFYMGLGIGGLLTVIALIQMARAKKDKTWDGVIVDKKIKQPRLSESSEGDYRVQCYIKIRLEEGKTKNIQCTEELFNYYQKGERVRHYAGTASHILDKYDKTHDAIIFCIACSSKNDINHDVCHRCKCPLLK